MIDVYSIQAPFGTVQIEADADSVIAVTFRESGPSVPQKETLPLLLETARQLSEYFEGRRRVFALPLRPRGTPFQLRVWNALLSVPYGETRSYKDIAQAIGQTQACRAVGMACKRNPLAILIPCHRIVGTDGRLTGYAGGLAVKKWLLAREY